MGEPSSSWQNFNFRDDEGSAQGMQALRLLLAKLQEAQANPRLKPSVNNLLMTEDLMLTSTQRLPSSVAPMHLEGGEGVPVMHGPMQANVVPHPLQGPLQTDGAKKKQYHGQERHVGKIREEGDFHDDDDEPPSQSHHKKRTNERRTKRSRRNSSGGSSSSSQSGRSSHGWFPKKDMFKMFATEDRLDGDNYPIWVYMMQHVLVSKGIWNIVKGIDVHLGSKDVVKIEDVAGLATRIAVDIWNIVKGIDVHPGSKDAGEIEDVAEFAKQAWDILASHYVGRNEAKIALLCKELESKIMKEENDMDTFLPGVKDVNEQLISASEVISDSSLVQTVLDALLDSYQTFVST
ncbi:hypothetical protein L7F22_001603 [Adiantum nelumboides]|nr:hypothetical protein [Adiantum nelumboides]